MTYFFFIIISFTCLFAIKRGDPFTCDEKNIQASLV